MIRFEGVSVTYDGAAEPVLRDVDLHLPEGELYLIVGSTGSGKSTLLKAVNGLVPRFTGGTLAGRVLVGGRSTQDHPPRELADVVGYVGQDPAAGFVSDSVEEELAYVMESLGLPESVMRTRVEETLDLLGLVGVRNQPLSTLSGGQQQRVAIGAALTAHPQVLLLDEPTSALDPGAAEEVLAALHRLVHDLGMTVLVAEHRLERVAQYADRVLWLPTDGPPVLGDPGEVLSRAPVAPPVVRLAQLAGWSRPPVSVRDARRLAGPLRERLEGHLPPVSAPVVGSPLLQARGIQVRYGGTLAVRAVDLQVGGGELVALMGRNGSGKSSLLWACQGSGARSAGTVLVEGTDPKSQRPEQRRGRIGLVPQQPADLLYLHTVGRECAQADSESEAAPGTCRAHLDTLAPGIPDEIHPRDLSEGQRLSLVLAIALTPAPRVLLLDEPTRGLDYPAKSRLARTLRSLTSDGHAVVIASHDVEFVAECATRVVVLADGDVVADGPVADVVTASPVFAPQVAKVLAPQRWLTVADVATAWESA